MAKQLLREIDPHFKLYSDPRTGIAWVENGHTGLGHSCHPSIDASGSIRGMKDRGWWGRRDRIVQSHGFKYNIDHLVVTPGDPLDELARQHCRCGGNH